MNCYFKLCKVLAFVSAHCLHLLLWVNYITTIQKLGQKQVFSFILHQPVRAQEQCSDNILHLLKILSKKPIHSAFFVFLKQYFLHIFQPKSIQFQPFLFILEYFLHIFFSFCIHVFLKCSTLLRGATSS